MPTYEYHCKNCGYQLQKLQKITESPLKKCEQCLQETLQRGWGGGVGLSFQGSGFYITDYTSKSTAPKAETTPSKKQSGDGNK